MGVAVAGRKVVVDIWVFVAAAVGSSVETGAGLSTASLLAQLAPATPQHKTIPATVHLRQSTKPLLSENSQTLSIISKSHKDIMKNF